GVLLFLVIKLWIHAGRELKASQEARIESEREHGKEKLLIERECNKEMAGLVKQQDMTLGAVESTLQTLSEKIDNMMED
ncbi:MAG: hypothetical protein GTO63_00310, partial [Anaerolineae bacterium]|nr:hypothetical protein [Anaerolineae bacterium]NIN93441.1 hypothetical protein [Anaerolineae bacterium]NIQ76803.1 hypothetical protein [Anaerolineae bacterium]